MRDLKWSESERKVARRVFDVALQQELAEIVAKFKEKAACAVKPDEMWNIEAWLAQRRREIDVKYDFRYSQLVMLFGRLVRENRVNDRQLLGLSEDKLSYIEHIASL